MNENSNDKSRPRLVKPGFRNLQLLVSDALWVALNGAAEKDLRTKSAFVTKLMLEHASIREFMPKAGESLSSIGASLAAPVCRLGFLPDGSVDRGYPDHLLPPEAIAARAAAGWPPVKPN